MPVLFYVLAALGFGFVIFIHELGHFVFAKWAGARVDVFSIGFGPRILWKTWGETEYRLSLLPFGGYVAIHGQEDLPTLDEQVVRDPRHFLGRPFAWRVAIMLGGVLFNFVSSYLILLGLAFAGMPVTRPQVGQVVSQMTNLEGTQVDSPATRLGLRRGDRILSMNGETVRSFDDIMATAVIDSHSPVTMTVLRRGSTQPLHLPADGAVVTPMYSREAGMTQLGISWPTGDRLAAVGVFGSQPGHPEPGERVMAVDGAPTAEPGQVPLCGQEIEEELLPWVGRTVSLTLEKNGVQRSAQVPYAGGPDSAFSSGYPVQILSVIPGGPAATAGIQGGDIILAVDGRPVANILQAMEWLRAALEAHPTSTLSLARPGAEGATTRLELAVAGRREAGGQMRIDVHLSTKVGGRLPALPRLADGSVSPLEAALTKASLGVGDAVLAQLDNQAGQDRNDDAGAPLALLAVHGGTSIAIPLGEAGQIALEHVDPYPPWARLLRMPEPTSIAAALIGTKVLEVAANGTVRVQVAGSDVQRRVDLEALREAQVDCSAIKAGDWVTGLEGTTAGPALELLRDAPTPVQVTYDPGVILAFDREEERYQLSSWREAFTMVDSTSYNMVAKTLQLLPRFFRSPEQGGIDPNKSLTGPVGMAYQLKMQVQHNGISSYLRLLALIGLNLFLVNLLPIPITDGGQLLIMFVEQIIRRPLPSQLRFLLTMTGLLLVVGLMVYVLGLDISRLL